MIQKAIHTATAFTVLILLSLFSQSCNKTSKVKWIFYDETHCADKWEFTNNNERLKQNITEYLDGKGIKVLEIEIFRQIEAETCSACTCKTGRQIKCKVKRGDLDEAKDEGFYE
jgi:hypothetical protein